MLVEAEAEAEADAGTDAEVVMEVDEDMSVVESDMISGARKDGVPAVLERSESSMRMGSVSSEGGLRLPAAASRWAYEKCETPKSVILTVRRSSDQRRFAGLMSRWMIPWLWTWGAEQRCVYAGSVDG